MCSLLVAFGLAAGITAAEPAETLHLSDVAGRMAICPTFTGLDTTPYRVWPKAIPGTPIRIGKSVYTKGLGVDAPSEIIVALDGEFETFVAEVGAQRDAGSPGPLVFRVLVDGQLRFESRALGDKDDAQPIRVSVRGARELRLATLGGGMCNWANARLTRSDSATSPVPAEPVDMAPFARVVYWDPDRARGVPLNYSEEFPAGDVFLEKDMVVAANGTYTVPTTPDGRGCIGLQWMELRRIGALAIQFARGARIPSAAGVRVETWVGGADYVTGESLWQGEWRPLAGPIEIRGDTWVVNASQETRKIRWVFPASAQPIVVRRLLAHTNSRWGNATLQFCLEHPLPGTTGQVEVYNGAVSKPEESSFRTQCDWDLSGPLRLKVRYTRLRPWGSDRTVVRVRLPHGSFAVAVDDLLPDEFPPSPSPRYGGTTGFKTVDDTIEDLRREGCVYVKEYGFFATAEPVKVSLADYKRKIAGRSTILEEVRRKPDQDFSHLLEKVYFARQDVSPTMLSLAADNSKFVVDRDGTTHFGTPVLTMGLFVFPDVLKPRFGSGRNEGLSRRLDGGWLPVPVTAVRDGGVEYTQRTGVIDHGRSDPPSQIPRPGSHPLCVVEFALRTISPNPAAASLRLSFASEDAKASPPTLDTLGKRVRVRRSNELLAVVDLAEAAGLQVRIQGGTVVLEGMLPAGSPACVYVYVPGWNMKPDDHASLSCGAALWKDAGNYWRGVLKSAAEIDLPDTMLTNLIRSSQVHCLMVARSGDGGKEIEPWIASNCYGVLDSESQVVLRGMDFFGHHEFARKSLEFFSRRYTPSGFLVSGYTYGPGMGQHLAAIGDHYQLTKDAPWLRLHAPTIANACRYVARQTEKTRRLDARGEHVPEYGLLSPGRFADWGHWGFIFSINGHAYAGLNLAARALAEIGLAEAGALADRAGDHRSEIRRAYQWMTARMPVVPLRDGTWVPAAPYEMGSPGPIQQFYPNLSIWYYDHLGGPHYLVAQGVLDAQSREAAWMVDYLEDTQFLKGWESVEHPDYRAEKHRNWFDWGGLAKSQPYYMHYLETYALRDDVKPFLRSYLNSAAMSINRENLTFWENVWGTAAWDKTHETGNFLYQSRILLVMEQGDQLWLAPFVSNRWTKDGQVVAVRRAPSYFGQVSYRIESHANSGHIDATVQSPTRNPPKTLVLRLRHPDGKPIHRVMVDDANHADFDAAKEIVRLRPSTNPIHVRAEY